VTPNAEIVFRRQLCCVRCDLGLEDSAEKTQLIWIGTGQQLAKLTVTQLQLINSVVEFDSTATNLGVVLDDQLSMYQQVTAVCRSCFYQLRDYVS